MSHNHSHKLTTLVIVSVTILMIAGLIWQAVTTHKRIAQLESRVQGLVAYLGQDLPAIERQVEQPLRDEYAQVERFQQPAELNTTSFAPGVNENRPQFEIQGQGLPTEERQAEQHLSAEYAEVERLQQPTELNTVLSAPKLNENRLQLEAVVNQAGAEQAVSQQTPDSANDVITDSSLRNEQAFDEMFNSMRDALGLEKYRWIEVEAELQQSLESLWPEYIAASKSPNPDTAGLRRRYCARLQAILQPEEVERLGCGEGVVQSTQ